MSVLEYIPMSPDASLENSTSDLDSILGKARGPELEPAYNAGEPYMKLLIDLIGITPIIDPTFGGRNHAVFGGERWGTFIQGRDWPHVWHRYDGDPDGIERIPDFW